MKIFNHVLIICFSLISISCNSKDEINKLCKSIDSLTKEVDDLHQLISITSKYNAKIILDTAEGDYCKILLFRPNGLRCEITNIRPKFKVNNFLCVPAAFTSKTNDIDGVFVLKNTIIKNQINKTVNGICILYYNKINFDFVQNIQKDTCSNINSSDYSLFQQSLLIKDSLIVPCPLFDNSLNLRRAFIQLDDTYMVCESKTAVSILDFQKSLLSIGVVNAIYLDMGSWSEGWYKNDKLQKVSIGQNFSNTSKQTNWLVYTNK